MRAFLYSLVLVIALGVGAQMQVRLPPDRVAGVQSGLETRTEKAAEELRKHVEGNRLGQLSSKEVLSFYRWGLAVRTWKKERGAGVAPLMAEGVLMDCLSRLRGLKGFPLQPGRGILREIAGQYGKDAVKAFDAALKIDPNQMEARMRRARLRATTDVRALVDLEAVANDAAGSPLSYLAAISRAAIAHNNGDTTSAIRWYGRARALHPRSTAAAVGLHALTPDAQPFEGLDTDDLYYTYPCTVLTPGVQAQVAARVKRVGDAVPR